MRNLWPCEVLRSTDVLVNPSQGCCVAEHGLLGPEDAPPPSSPVDKPLRVPGRLHLPPRPIEKPHRRAHRPPFHASKASADTHNSSGPGGSLAPEVIQPTHRESLPPSFLLRFGFVCGTHFSGTSIIHVTLGMHPDVRRVGPAPLRSEKRVPPPPSCNRSPLYSPSTLPQVSTFRGVDPLRQDEGQAFQPVFEPGAPQAYRPALPRAHHPPAAPAPTAPL